MSNNDIPEIEYGDRETLDAELTGAISEIMSAEAEARRIIAQAEASVKAIQLDGAARERDMRENNGKAVSNARTKALADAADAAEKELARIVEEAEQVGGKMLKEKKKLIEAQIKKLYVSVGGKA